MSRNPWDEPLASHELSAEQMVRAGELRQIVADCAKPLQQAVSDLRAKIAGVLEVLNRNGSMEELARAIEKANEK